MMRPWGLAPQQGNRSTTQRIRRDDVDPEVALQLRRWRRLEALPVVHETRVVDQHVELSEGIRRRPDEYIWCVGRRDVADHMRDLRAFILQRRGHVADLRVDVHEDETGATRREQPRMRLTHAPRGTGHQGHPAVESGRRGVAGQKLVERAHA